MSGSEYGLLLKELELLQDVLPSSIPKQVSIVKKENENNDSEKQVV